MRKFIVLGLVALFVVASQVPTQAAGRMRSGRISSGNRQGVFARMMELERAKNQWLFGR
jgi:hypothetical protein